MNYQVEVRVTPRAGILDPQGKAVESALHTLNFPEVDEARVGRLIRLRIAADSEAAARERVEAMCRQLLANPVTEDYEIALSQPQAESVGT
ncbi:MAG TPA: phosphoribosylformylglycinamidine synthase subunit PurS [Geothrix sp.]|nr:phosphoribosylformylglycinamidine synthase subunit PurS [Geothrix sp.]